MSENGPVYAVLTMANLGTAFEGLKRLQESAGPGVAELALKTKLALVPRDEPFEGVIRALCESQGREVKIEPAPAPVEIKIDRRIGYARPSGPILAAIERANELFDEENLCADRVELFRNTHRFNDGSEKTVASTSLEGSGSGLPAGHHKWVEAISLELVAGVVDGPLEVNLCFVGREPLLKMRLVPDGKPRSVIGQKIRQLMPWGLVEERELPQPIEIVALETFHVEVAKIQGETVVPVGKPRLRVTLHGPLLRPANPDDAQNPRFEIMPFEPIEDAPWMQIETDDNSKAPGPVIVAAEPGSSGTLLAPFTGWAIVDFDGVKVRTAGELRVALSRKSAGDRVQVTVASAGTKTVVVAIELAKRPASHFLGGLQRAEIKNQQARAEKVEDTAVRDPVHVDGLGLKGVAVASGPSENAGVMLVPDLPVAGGRSFQMRLEGRADKFKPGERELLVGLAGYLAPLARALQIDVSQLQVKVTMPDGHAGGFRLVQAK